MRGKNKNGELEITKKRNKLRNANQEKKTVRIT